MKNVKIIIALVFLAITTNNSSAQAPVAPSGTNTQSWLGNSFIDYTNYYTMKRVPEEIEDIKFANGTVYFAGYHETGGGGASFSAADGSYHWVLQSYSGRSNK
jgi:hypothetical protein